MGEDVTRCDGCDGERRKEAEEDAASDARLDERVAFDVI